MHSVVAYILSLIAMPLVGLATFLLMVPVSLAAHQSGPTAEKLEEFSSRALSAFLMATVAWCIFGWLEASFTLWPILLMAGLLALLNGHGTMLYLRAYEARIAELGLSAKHPGDVLWLATQSDKKAQQLYRLAGQQIAALVGSLLGFSISAWWYLFR